MEINPNCCSNPANLCESPPVQRETITCTKDCVTYQTVRIKNADDVNTYKRLVGSTCCSTEDLEVRSTACCTPEPGLSFDYCKVQDDIAGWYRGTERHGCHAYGTVPPTIREVPSADVFMINHEFIELVMEAIAGCLDSCNLGQSTREEVHKYAQLYLTNFNKLDSYIEDSMSEQLEGTVEYEEVLFAKRKELAILKAIDKTTKGNVYGCNES